MKKLITAALLALAIVAPAFAVNPFIAADRGLPIKRADIPCAHANVDSFHFTVSDCASSTNCSSGGTATAIIMCDGGSVTYPGVASASPTFTGTVVAPTIQGVTGSNKAKVTMDDTNGMRAYGNGSGVTAPRLYLGTTGTLRGPSDGSMFSAGSTTASISAQSANVFESNGTGYTMIVATPLMIYTGATLPTCDSTLTNGGVGYAIAIDTTGPDLCICNGSAWAPVDGSGTCT